jgi:predicted PurR-regulated permease PerM
MADKAKDILFYTVLLIIGLTFLFWGLVEARTFLLPLTVGALLAMIILPVCRWLEQHHIPRGWASFLSDLLLILFFAGLASVLAAQFDSLEDDWPRIQESLEPKISRLQEFIADKTGLSVQEQEQTIPGDLPGFEDDTNTDDTDETKNGQKDAEVGKGGSTTKIFSTAGTVLSQIISTLGNLLLIFVYIFFFLLYRRKFKRSVLKMVPEERQAKTNKIISDATRVSQSYLLGRILMILFLVVLYSIGLSLSGIRNAILISLLAAVLSLIPYIGNVIGFTLAVIMAFISGSGFTGAIGVAITFTITQFVESYILEPYVVGDQVDLNPVFTIIVVVLGGVLWGIVGMLIAIPLLGILKVIFDHVSVLQPLGYLFGEEDMDDEDGNNFFKKTKQWALNKFHSF